MTLYKNLPSAKTADMAIKQILLNIYSSKYFDSQLMWYKIEKICLSCVHFSVYLIISLSQVMGVLNLMCIWQKKLSIANWPIEGKKHYVFARKLSHTKACIWFKYPPINAHWTFLVVTWIWLWPLTDILQKLLLSDGDPRMLLLQSWGPESQGPGPTFTPCHVKKRNTGGQN